ncbi:MAG: hypothetical protein NZ482_09725 [Gloeomargarita sp. SKYG98]|nr:hypothetical protein [Gloeomargarita sp. SKYG98]
MSMPYSTDLRQKAIEVFVGSTTLVEVRYRALQRWLKQWSETGDYLPKRGIVINFASLSRQIPV